jgi:hypothetical protein
VTVALMTLFASPLVYRQNKVDWFPDGICITVKIIRLFYKTERKKCTPTCAGLNSPGASKERSQSSHLPPSASLQISCGHSKHREDASRIPAGCSRVLVSICLLAHDFTQS